MEVRACFGKVTPQNLSYLYSKMTQGEHLLEELFQVSDREMYIVSTPGCNGSFKKGWIFGGDDTLWEDNVVYEDIIRIFVDHVCRYIVSTDPAAP